MNKAEKELAKKVKAFYNLPPETHPGFTREESLILERWRTHEMLNKDAFFDVTGHNSNHKEYIQNCLNYPFTSLGDEEIKKDWYLRFRDSKSIIIVRDIFTVVAFFLSVYVTILKILQK